ncbi:MAG: hypothetical protein QOG72_2444 [Sphingomonadales bacterium]|jgi:hypothetical protein|nr:hypothetical protein [Sphingomonadales bacterium]
MISVGEIEDLLKGRAENLCFELFPNGRREGRDRFRIGSLAGEAGQSLWVEIGGGKCGNWRDGAGGTVAGRDRGDLLWLVACALFGGDLGQAVAWAKSWLQLDDQDPARLERHRIEAKAAGEARARQAAEGDRRARASARKRWHMGVPIPGTPVEIYLASRGICLRALGRAPGALRFNPEVQYGFGDGAARMPAMLAAVTALDGEHVATHRTWLAPDGSDKAAAPPGVEGFKPKKVLGRFEGAHIPLWKGACGSMPLRDVPEGTDIWVSEGIEDGLTAACADPSLRVIAGISVSNIGTLELPPKIGALVILAQNDPPGSDAEKALGRAIAAQRARGVRVKVARPPRDVKDVNALAQRELVAA